VSQRLERLLHSYDEALSRPVNDIRNLTPEARMALWSRVRVAKQRRAMRLTRKERFKGQRLVKMGAGVVGRYRPGTKVLEII